MQTCMYSSCLKLLNFVRIIKYFHLIYHAILHWCYIVFYFISFKKLEQFVTSFASSLHHVMSGDHTHIEQDHTPMVALCSLVRLEWYIADYACALIGIPSVS